MALDAFVAGRYQTNYNAVGVGLTTNGIELQQTSHAELINQSDAYGDSVIDWVYRGGDVFVVLESKTFKNGALTPFWPYGQLGVMQISGAPIGRLGTAISAALVLNSTAGSAFATTGAMVVNTLTASQAALAPSSPLSILFNSRLRTVPLRLQCLPYETTNSGVVTTQWFTVT